MFFQRLTKSRRNEVDDSQDENEPDVNALDSRRFVNVDDDRITDDAQKEEEGEQDDFDVVVNIRIRRGSRRQRRRIVNRFHYDSKQQRAR